MLMGYVWDIGTEPRTSNKGGRNMFNGLVMFYRSILGEIEDSWCIRCRSHRKVVKMGYEIISTSRGTKGLLQGKCTTCDSKTSSFVKVA